MAGYWPCNCIILLTSLSILSHCYLDHMLGQPSKLLPFCSLWRLKFWSYRLVLKNVALNQKSLLPNGNRAKHFHFEGCWSIAHRVCTTDHMEILLNCTVSVCTLSTLTQLVSKYCKTKMHGHLQINFQETHIPSDMLWW